MRPPARIPNPKSDMAGEAAAWPAACSLVSRLPDAFCWTKMQAEAGQSLEEIVARKEMERSAGRGIFFWGVGNALGERVKKLVERAHVPRVAFSMMRSRPKAEDSAPAEVLLWTAYVDPKTGVRPLPSHVLLLSRGTTANGEKRRHYALVCRSENRLEMRHRGTIHLGQFRNLGSSTPNVGASQVTAVLEHHGGTREGLSYDVHLVACLMNPYFVRLAEPRILTLAERDVVARVSAGFSSTDWLRFVSELRAAGRPTHGFGQDAHSIEPSTDSWQDA